MIVGGRIGDAKTNHNPVQKWRRIQRHFLRTVILPGAEYQFVSADAKIISLKQRLVCAAVGVGNCGLEQEALIAIDGIKADGKSGGRFTANGIEDMSGELAHYFMLSDLLSVRPKTPNGGRASV